MKLSHLNAIAQSFGFDNIEQYLRTRYVTEMRSLEYVAAEIEMSESYIAGLLDQFGIEKPVRKIDLSVEDAKRLDLMTIAKNLGVSRATAWRWKRKVLADAQTKEDEKDPWVD